MIEGYNSTATASTNFAHGTHTQGHSRTWAVPFLIVFPDVFFVAGSPINACHQGLHTLCLLDIRVKEPSVEALCRGRKEYEPPRFMSVGVAASQLIEIEANRKEEGAPRK